MCTQEKTTSKLISNRLQGFGSGSDDGLNVNIGLGLAGDATDFAVKNEFLWALSRNYCQYVVIKYSQFR